MDSGNTSIGKKKKIVIKKVSKNVQNKNISKKDLPVLSLQNVAKSLNTDISTLAQGKSKPSLKFLK